MGANMNVVMLNGNLTRDIDSRVTSGGVAIAKFGVAVNGWREGDVSFFDVTAFAKTAEFLAQYARKGSSVNIRGRLKQDRWEDKQTGQNRSKVEIDADEVQLLDKPPAREELHADERAAREPASTVVMVDAEEDDGIPF